MLSEMQKLSKGLIVYSAVLSDFEKPDFKNDALAGVRANYFNSNHCEQRDRTSIMLDDRVYSLSYRMRQGEPLSWKVSYSNMPCQSVRLLNRAYCVLCYGESGTVVKRIYFDEQHIWQRTEYYDRRLSDLMLGCIAPHMVDGVLTIRYLKYDRGGAAETHILYPSTDMPRKRCAGLIYTNSGMIWYDESFRKGETDRVSDSSSDDGFNFKPENFTNTGEAKADLRNAPYLSADDIPGGSAIAQETGDEREYSAYEKIEHILYEASKTNKNIFGEVVSFAGSGDEETAGETDIESVENSNAEESTENISKNTEEITEDAKEEEASSSESNEVQPEFEQTENPEPDREINTTGGVYRYYGDIDENGNRTGRGRIVSPDGITVYDGGYSDDKREGFGVCYYKDGTPNYAGAWSDSARNGSGVGFRHSDGTLHVGKWDNNVPVGIGARFDRDGSFLDICGYLDGSRHGKSLSFDNEGRVVLRIYDNGELISERILDTEENGE